MLKSQLQLGAMPPPRALGHFCLRSLQSLRQFSVARLPPPAASASSSWIAAAAAGSQQPAGRGAQQLDDVLANIRASQKLGLRGDSHVRVTGTATHLGAPPPPRCLTCRRRRRLQRVRPAGQPRPAPPRPAGIRMAWELRCRPDGAFREEVRSPQLCASWGYDGGGAAGGDAACWDMDFQGCPRSLVLDDHEEMLLSVWIRSGAWLSPATEGALEVSLAPDDAAGAAGEAAAADTGAGTTAAPLLFLDVRLREGKVSAVVGVCTETWRTVSISQPAPSAWDTDCWRLSGWTEWERG